MASPFQAFRGGALRGHVAPAFWPVAREFERQLRGGGGAAVCVYWQGHKVVDLWGGRRDRQGRPWARDTAAMSFSTTKGVVSTALHVLADRGALDYDAPVAEYWPEFGQSGKQRTTVRALLSHRAGLPALRPLIDHGERILDWDHMVDALARARQRTSPRRPAYHALTFGWLAGELVQRVAGRPLRQVIREELAEPLGLDALGLGAPGHERARTAELMRPLLDNPVLSSLISARPLAAAASALWRGLRIPLDPLLMQDALIPAGRANVLWSDAILDAVVPAANGVFTARALAGIYAALAGDGELGGRRILSARTVGHLSEVQTRASDRVLLLPMHWRLGYHSAFTLGGRVPGGFGHFGYGGSGAWADRENGLAFAMVTNRLGGGPFGDLRVAALGSAAQRSARRAHNARLDLVPEPADAALA